MEATGAAIMFRIDLHWIGLEADVVTYMPVWIGKIVCKFKDHEWTLLGECCSRCFKDGAE